MQLKVALSDHQSSQRGTIALCALQATFVSFVYWPDASISFASGWMLYNRQLSTVPILVISHEAGNLE